jgi:hypothetical protein
MINARAAIEQMSSGQIGQPAACMIESNMALSVERRRLGPHRSLELWRAVGGLRNSVTPRVTFRTSGRCSNDLPRVGPQVDNFVDKLPRQGLGAVKSGLGRPAAQKNGTKNSLNINHLQHSIAAEKVRTVRNASIGAAVERSPRASGRSADG